MLGARGKGVHAHACSLILMLTPFITILYTRDDPTNLSNFREKNILGSMTRLKQHFDIIHLIGNFFKKNKEIYGIPQLSFVFHVYWSKSPQARKKIISWKVFQPILNIRPNK